MNLKYINEKRKRNVGQKYSYITTSLPVLYNFQQSHTKLYKFIEQTKSPHHILSVRSEDTTNVKEKSLHRYDTTNNYNQLVVTESSIKHR